MPLPKFADTAVIGGGTAGAAVAGLLAEHSAQSVVLLEAGPDYGPFAAGRWPVELINAGAIPITHDWGYNSGEMYAPRVIGYERARVIGGCSSHNGCAAIWGSSVDYDGWAALGNPGWSTDELRPLFRAGSDRLRVRIPEPGEVTPFQRISMDAAVDAGIPRVADLNNLDENLGMAPRPANIVDGVRWNTAFAYLDPVRERSNLAILANSTCERLEISSGRINALVVAGREGPVRIEAGRVVVAAGTYGSPAILLRSGIGDSSELRAAGITPMHDLPGVGQNLHDHPRVTLIYAGTHELEEMMTAFARDHWMPEEQTIAKARSSQCTQAFDLHVYPVGGPDSTTPTGWRWTLEVVCLTPRSNLNAKSGLWKTINQSASNGQQQPAVTAAHCIKPQNISAHNWVFLLDAAADDATCTRMAFNSSSNTIAWKFACRGQSPRTTQGSIKFDTPQHYSGTVSIKGGATANNPSSGDVLHTEGTWVGACIGTAN